MADSMLLDEGDNRPAPALMNKSSESFLDIPRLAHGIWERPKKLGGKKSRQARKSVTMRNLAGVEIPREQHRFSLVFFLKGRSPSSQSAA